MREDFFEHRQIHVIPFSGPLQLHANDTIYEAKRQPPGIPDFDVRDDD